MAKTTNQQVGYNFGVIPTKPYNFFNKEQCVRNYIIQMLTRTSRMFKYENLPDTIPARDLEMLLQTCGFVTFAKVKGKLYAFGYTNGCGIGGEYNAYIMPTKAIISNAYLRMTGQEFTIDKDCVVVRSDSMYQGLNVINERYATQLVNNDITIQRIQENARHPFVLKATTDEAQQSCINFLSTVVDGKPGAILDNPIFEGVESVQLSFDQHIKDYIEMQQYIKASWCQELGLNANYNMKRESLTDSEILLNEDMLTPLVNDMLECRKEDIVKVNVMFGTNITVELGSTWKENDEQRTKAMDGNSNTNEEEITDDGE